MPPLPGHPVWSIIIPQHAPPASRDFSRSQLEICGKGALYVAALRLWN